MREGLGDSESATVAYSDSQADPEHSVPGDTTMKALILAAGDGNRIRSMHEAPKCLIRSNQTQATILDYQIEALFLAGVTKIGIVVGYEMHQIKSHVRQRYRTCPGHFDFIENAAYAQTDTA